MSGLVVALIFASVKSWRQAASSSSCCTLAAAHHAPALCNPQARARTVAMADRESDSLLIPKKKKRTYKREMFGHSVVGLKKKKEGAKVDGFTMRLSSCSAATAPAFALVAGGAGAGLVGRGYCGCCWCPGGTVRRAGGRVCLPLWARAFLT
jgi:hypothetical protein